MSDGQPVPGRRALRLTEDHVRRVARVVDEPAYDPDWHLLDDDDLDRLTEALIGDRPRPVPIFAYGSLIWNPDFSVTRRYPAKALGWHRAFSIPLDRFRGSPEQPGLMLALASGGECEGLILEIEPGTEMQSMRTVLARELVARELAANACWITVRTEHGIHEALTFYADPVGIKLADLPIEEQAKRLAYANGAAGSGCEYLLRTAQGLEVADLYDPYIWKLADLVAAEIDGWFDKRG